MSGRAARRPQRTRRTLCAIAALAVISVPAQARAEQISLFVSGVQAVAGRDYHVYGPSSIVGPGDGGVGSAPVDLGGIGLWAELDSDPNCETIPLLPDGQTYTLVATTGGLTGTLNGLPEGAVERLRRYDGGGHLCEPQPMMGLQIHYDPSGPVQTVTATVVKGSPWPVSYTRVVAQPWRQLQVNQPSTLTATLEVSSGTAGGTVSFSAGQPFASGRPLDCPSAHVVVAANAPATATCEAGFSLEDWFRWPGEPAPTATFTPDDPGTVAGSFGRHLVSVSRGTTTTALRRTHSRKLVATVTPGYGGTFSPTGSVVFSADGSPIPGCTAQPLTGSGTSRATCRTCPLGPGAHEIIASYAGDANFDGSTSDAESLAIVPSPPPHAPDSRPSPQLPSTDPLPVAPSRVIVIIPRTTRHQAKHRFAPRRRRPAPRCKRPRHGPAAHVPRGCRRR